ncbi:MAG: hemolysin III family protein [Lachnospiraceae bacterium]|nr:hemolysin III family protein [Lachnospiraceae bacterium]
MSVSIREPGSAITHAAGIIMALIAAIPLLTKAVGTSVTSVTAAVIFLLSLVALYSASTIYHSVVVPKRTLRYFQKADHMMIFVLIAGTYTPVCMLTLRGRSGNLMLIVIWTLAAMGIFVKMCWITCPKWFSSLIYIAMGWSCVIIMKPLIGAFEPAAMAWLAGGGIIYTIGGVIYALKLPLFNSRHKNFGSHEIFHLFVLAGSLCHIVFMYKYVL